MKGTSLGTGSQFSIGNFHLTYLSIDGIKKKQYTKTICNNSSGILILSVDIG